MTTITRNEKLNGIEIKFDKAPIPPTRQALKDNGFRWHSKKKIWYAKVTPQTEEFIKLFGIESKSEKKTVNAKEKINKFGVKVGDIFSASWGYDQTNNDFFQVIELVGCSSVRVREVYLPLIKSEAVSGMSADRTFKVEKELLPAAPHSVFIKDQEKGDLKRLKSYSADGISNPQFYLSSFADAHYCSGETIEVYDSWYA